MTPDLIRSDLSYEVRRIDAPMFYVGTNAQDFGQCTLMDEPIFARLQIENWCGTELQSTSCIHRRNQPDSKSHDIWCHQVRDLLKQPQYFFCASTTYEIAPNDEPRR
jgi:hypothetical protein